MRRFLVTAIFVLCIAATAFGGPIDDIKKAQAGVKTVKASFKQEKITELYERPIKSEGTFYFKSSVGVRWEYGDEMQVIYDGKTLYIYYIQLDEAEKIQGVSGFVGPLSFDMTELLKDFKVESREEGGAYHLHLVPKKDVPFETMDMVFEKGAAFPGQVTITEKTGDHTKILFAAIKTNVKLANSLFVFNPPPGVEVRERAMQ
jgi:outer membrane lipoprotein carrier protein